MGTQHIIELNGKRYDAVTGEMVAAPPAHSQQKTKPAPVHQRNVDGFARPVRPLAAHKAERSKTLARKTVTQPKAAPKQAAAAAKHVDVAHPRHPSVVPKKVVKAAHVQKSPMVKRFNEVVSTKAPAFASQGSQHLAAITAPIRAISDPASVATNHNPLAAGLFNARSHEEPEVRREHHYKRIARRLHVSPHVVSTGALMVAVLLLGGFFALQNMAGLNMRVASARSGVKGSLPTYQPAGFTLNSKISYKPGEIALKYRSNSDSRNFQLIQTTSNWNSTSLLENFVAVNHPNYQTVMPKGKTVFLYDNNATWVDSGIWYRVEGDSKLNSDQLQNIANSL